MQRDQDSVGFDRVEPNTTTRRTLIKSGSALAAGAVLATNALGRQSAAANPSGANIPGPAMQLLDQETWLLNRASFGFTQTDLADVQSRGILGWVDWQLNPSAIPDPVMDQELLAYPWLGQSPDDLLRHPTKNPQRLGWEYLNLRLLRAVHSKRQLFERLIQFWSDHFSVYAVGREIAKIEEDTSRTRALALGPFRDLLQANAKSAVMMDFLDTDTNVVGAPNENYAREVMELHTLGVTGPYTEQDIRELARCFTGWEFVTPEESLATGNPNTQFRFNASQHDTGAKSLLGISIPAGGGVQDAESVLDHLASHPATAEYICTKLVRWFLVYDPPRSIIDAAIATWNATGGVIGEVIRAILTPQNLLLAQPWKNPKLKRPFHWLASTLRSLESPGFDVEGLTWDSHLLGQPCYVFLTPDGYPDLQAAWGGLLQPRWGYASDLGGHMWNHIGLTANDLRARLQGVPMGNWIAYLNMEFSGGAMLHRDVQILQAYVDSHYTSPTDQAVGETFELILSSPTFQLY